MIHRSGESNAQLGRWRAERTALSQRGYICKDLYDYSKLV
jgi:hypothetical protein